MPPGLERLVLRMLAKDPADRPGSAAEVASLLEVVAAGPAIDPAAITKPTPRSSILDISTRGRRMPVAALILAAATALVIVLSGIGGGAAKPTALRQPPSNAPSMRAHINTGRPAVTSTQVATTEARASAPPRTVAADPAANPAPPGQPPPPPPGKAKKPKPPKPPKPSDHVPPGHGGVPPGQAGKSAKGSD